MNWQNFRLTKRLNFEPKMVEEIYSIISEIDGVKNSWKITGKLLPQVIKRLTHFVIVTSTGSSNRIEGNKLTDLEVEKLYKNLRIKKFKTRDEQEVAGYLEILEQIFNHYKDMSIKESLILQTHNQVMKYSAKDEGHRGKYKYGPNRVEAKDSRGKIVGVVFNPSPPYLVAKEMNELIAWYNWSITKTTKHPLILIANFIFEYLAIHPFQDGNGRTSRLLTNIMLLRNNYNFSSIVSHEKLIEENKADYYLALNKTQKKWKTKKEDITPWLLFFLKIVKLQAINALKILESDNVEYLFSEKQMALWQWANNNSNQEFTRKDAIKALGFQSRTVESILKKLVEMKKITKLGQGRATRYRVIS
jgi:Fic family protein